ncbi:MAG TPA: 1-(5-phosphoribosyl)-5-[(5-phosphoribosylamino)methylideneamino]imidazole-4-carboxamide isomerase [Deltaproteobacteria bacterium]|mgnify:CR=1 FL=1|nr:1-(5-phosphoribosyl)-5-[(5-phosphoribosylamino)methylideneamino]imidazole-4-carboxamide isomerase [Deltaproteobacteria bacterium]HPR55508.1 1-(5-phosphoribosyl)-5-[(5-phosphoribosylamino)methylideneamino]imidazole-4-carboxamide isomerase [Deltaproteobacteria bacterium]HXK48619.1 1-(5-phosphoribosyl)-5-[(5-phosphoribosylamino)methylideneamino]imidazole-4-carboxamide isomerase [Deltaproteobacteria bacterium]
MIVIPAIDLHQGQVVRLKKGRFDEVTVYGSNPAEIARSFQGAGARRIHVVDLDGSVAGKGMNARAIAEICSAVDAEVELGGGIRTVENAAQAFDLGVSYVILGTVTARDPGTTERILEAFPGKVGIGIDALDGSVAVQGWKELTSKTASELALYYERFGPAFIVYTDISRDGMLTGPNIEATTALAGEVKTPVVASGGVSSMDDIRALLAAGGLFGAIVGKAIYEGRVDVAEAVRLCREPESLEK